MMPVDHLTGEGIDPTPETEAQIGIEEVALSLPGNEATPNQCGPCQFKPRCFNPRRFNHRHANSQSKLPPVAIVAGALPRSGCMASGFDQATVILGSGRHLVKWRYGAVLGPAHLPEKKLPTLVKKF